MEENIPTQQTEDNKFPWLSLIIVLAAGAALYWLFTTNPPSEQNNQNNQDIQIYSSTDFGFSIGYPRNWKNQECKDNASLLVALGDRDQLVICSSDAPPNAYVMIGAVNSPYWTGTVEDQVVGLRTILDDVEEKEIMIDGIKATRVDGKMKNVGEEGVQFLPAGVKISQVIFIQGDRMYRMFFQDLANTGNTQEFDRIIESFDLTN